MAAQGSTRHTWSAGVQSQSAAGVNQRPISNTADVHRQIAADGAGLGLQGLGGADQRLNFAEKPSSLSENGPTAHSLKRGQQERSGYLYSYLSIEERFPVSDPLRRIPKLADQALDRLHPTCCRLYALEGRPSVPAKQLLLAASPARGTFGGPAALIVARSFMALRRNAQSQGVQPCAVLAGTDSTDPWAFNGVALSLATSGVGLARPNPGGIGGTASGAGMYRR